MLDIYEMNRHMQEMQRDLEEQRRVYDKALKTLVNGPEEDWWNCEEILGKNNLFTVHFHYGKLPKISIHTIGKDEIKERSVVIGDIEYLVTTKSITNAQIRKLHNRLMMAGSDD